jgi:phosphoglycolate phosphatase
MSIICAKRQEPEFLNSLNRSLLTPTSQLTVFCDLDGPLIDVSDRYYQTYQLALRETQSLYWDAESTFALTCLSKEQFWRMKQERTADIDIALRSGLQTEHIDYFLDQVRQVVNQPMMLEQDRVQPGVRSALTYLRDSGVSLKVVTLRHQVEAETLLLEQDLAQFFTGIWGTSDYQSAYSNYTDHKRRLLTQALEQFPALSLESAWMIGDTEADVLAGQSLGISTIALTCGIRSHDYLSKLQPTHIDRDLIAATQYLLGLV